MRVSRIAPATWRQSEAETFARVTGSSALATAAVYGIPIVSSIVAYKIAGGGLIGAGAALVAFPVAFVATGLVLVWQYGPGAKS